MNSGVLSSLGLDFIDPIYYIISLLVLIIILFILNIVSSKKIKNMQRTYHKFLSGKNAETLEGIILEKFAEIDDIRNISNIHSEEIKNINEDLSITFKKMGMVKYDAFNEMGGKLSFSLALLNEINTGFVINAMHSRDGCYLYIKEIIKGESYIPLGEEEKQALKNAIDLI